MSPRNKTIQTIAPRAGALAWLLLSTLAHADPGSRKLTLSVYLDTPGAESVLAGKYDDAIKQLRGHTIDVQRNVVSTSTNLCVALIMTQQWDAARSTCNDAVSEAKFNTADNVLMGPSANREQVATALSNRAVLNWLQNRPGDAASDVKRAHALAPRKDFVSSNFMVLNGNPQNVPGPSIASIRP
jgi:hypothetical protein